MNAVTVLYGGQLAHYAFEKVFDCLDAFTLALKKAAGFEYVSKIVLLVQSDFDDSRIPAVLQDAGRLEIIRRDSWNTQNFLDSLAGAADGFDLTYFAWADSPFLDIDLTKKIAARHIRYCAEYSYADGWPDALAPQLLSAGTAAILAKINSGSEEAVTRTTIFDVLQKDINSFDIETEISDVDLRSQRLLFAADSKRNLLLLQRFVKAGFSGAVDAARIITEKPEILRTLPAFFPVQISAACPQTCKICPYSPVAASFSPPYTSEMFMPPELFNNLLEKIVDFAGDAVIDLSLWGEISLHPQKIDLIKAVFAKKELSLIIETCGLGWKSGEIEEIAALSAAAAARTNGMAALSWIISLDSINEEKFSGLHSGSFGEALAFSKEIAGCFGKNAYIQTVRRRGEEEDCEAFYKFWKEAGANGAQIIVQKYDDFCKKLPCLLAADLSPVEREPCRHIMRDFPVLLDGKVIACREDLQILNFLTSELTPEESNVFNESMESIWQKGLRLYLRHLGQDYPAACKNCDEYWTFNF